MEILRRTRAWAPRSRHTNKTEAAHGKNCGSFCRACQARHNPDATFLDIIGQTTMHGTAVTELITNNRQVYEINILGQRTIRRTSIMGYSFGA